MSHQTLNLDGQLIESILLESDLESSLLSDNEANIVESDRSIKLATNSNSTNNLDLFADSEEASPLYSESFAMEGDDTEQPDPNDLEVPDVALTNSITVGSEDGTQFTFNFAEDTHQEVIDGVVEAAENWTSVLTDDVNINIDFTFNPSEPGNLGGAIPNQIPLSYEGLSQALADDVTSVNDQTAVTHLPEDSIDILINNTSENNGSDTPYLDDNGGLNNSFVVLNTANAKALGFDIEDIAESLGISPEEVVSELGINTISDNYIFDPNLADGTINLNSDVVWDFDTSDGISADATDFVGVATHEIGHVLGFTTNAEQFDTVADPNFDLLDVVELVGSEEINQLIADSGLGDIADAVDVDQLVSENEYLLQIFDLFRYTPESFEQDAVDYTAGNIDEKYFSIDGGNTVVAPLSTGREAGDGQQLSHWQDDAISGINIGIMDPTVNPGDLQQITDEDLIAFDVIGWDLA